MRPLSYSASASATVCRPSPTGWMSRLTHRSSVSGIYVRNVAEDPIWRLYDRIFDSFASGSFRSMPFLLSEESFLTTLGGSFEDMDSSYGWLLSVDSSRLNAGNSTHTRFSQSSV